MGPLVLLFNLSKVVGVAGILTVVANTLAFHRFRKKNLALLENLIDESDDILADFPINRDVDDGGFFFALATAPAHVEDKLNDAWLQFAQETTPKDQDVNPPETANERLGSSQSSEEIQAADRTEQKDEQVASGMERNSETQTEKITNEMGLNENRILARGLSEDALINAEEKMKGREGCNTPPMDEWEVINQGQQIRGKNETANQKLTLSDPGAVDVDKKINSDSAQTSSNSEEREHPEGQTYRMGSVVEKLSMETPKDQSKLKGSKGTVEEPTLQFNLPKKGRKLVKVAMEAMIRGIEKFVEEEEKTNVAAWQNTVCPEQRVRFWSDPDTELRLAKETNVTVFRMGVDWSRVMPVEPVDGIDKSVDWAALNRYRYIIERVHAHGMKVMLTLFHHSLPPWAGEYGGWKMEKTSGYFLEFTRLAVERFADLVDFWITFNEPHVFAMLTYCAGVWPGGHPDLLETVTSVLPHGVFTQVMKTMATSHLRAYDIIHEISKTLTKRARVGISHHVSFMRPYGLFDVSAVVFTESMTRFAFVDDICNKLDFIGINYYGQEVVSAPGLKLVENDEYSESGRGVYPDGLYRILMDFHHRYRKLNLPYIITENGVSDATDYIRRPYLLEHLLAVRAAMNKGVHVQGYCFWTTSDNWEWADGYGPKFGLAAVDRENGLARIPRPSYYLFAEVAKTGKVTREQRDKAWAELQSLAVQGKNRPFYRAVDSHGLMYAGGLDVPIERSFVQRDWRFGHYRFDGLQDPVSRLFRILWFVPLLGNKKSGKQSQKFNTRYTTIIPEPSSGDAKKSSLILDAQEDGAKVPVSAGM